MGLFSFLREPARGARTNGSGLSSRRERMRYADSSTIPADEKKFYKPDSYYTYYSHPETPDGRRVVTFEERKNSSFPSSTGLYVAEILLLRYVDKGDYPNPRSGYPAFWWFEYGVRDVGRALRSLEARDYIEWAPKSKSLNNLKVADLKAILADAGQETNGKKADLIQRGALNVPGEQYEIPGYVPKYQLTVKGRSELEANGYVPYMHASRYATAESENSSNDFNVWSINRLIGGGEVSNWKHLVGEIEQQRLGVNMAAAKDCEKMVQTAEEVKAYLAESADYIEVESKKGGAGFEEETAGLALKKVGKDKEALVNFYIAARKKFDAPALYKTAAVLLRKNKMIDEELDMLDMGVKYVSRKNTHWVEIADRRSKVQGMIDGHTH